MSAKIKPLQLLCVVPGDIYIDPHMDVWRYKRCDAAFDDLECYICEGELESLSSWFEKEEDSDVIVHDERHHLAGKYSAAQDGCVEVLVPAEIFIVYNRYHEIYKAEIDVKNQDRDSHDTRAMAENRYFDLVMKRVEELKINAKTDEE